jgi:hypothetical protein
MGGIVMYFAKDHDLGAAPHLRQQVGCRPNSIRARRKG